MSGLAEGAPADAAPSARRTFIEPRELPGLVLGAARGEVRALRRILGARRGGRYGFTLAGGIGLLATPLRSVPEAVAAFLLLGALCWVAQTHRPRLALREVTRLGLWTALPFLAIAVPVRVVDAGSVPAIVAIALGYGLLALWLSRGLGGIVTGTR